MSEVAKRRVIYELSGSGTVLSWTMQTTNFVVNSVQDRKNGTVFPFTTINCY